jgi:hypothetical protein
MHECLNSVSSPAYVYEWFLYEAFQLYMGHLDVITTNINDTCLMSCTVHWDFVGPYVSNFSSW